MNAPVPSMRLAATAPSKRAPKPPRVAALLTGGLLCGLAIVLGEAVLNMLILRHDWTALMTRFSLPPPDAFTAAQAVVKLVLLGVFVTWLACALVPYFGGGPRAAAASGLIVWCLVWAWVQWGMLLSGQVTTRIAAITVAWGLVELPVCALVGWWGTRIARRPATAPAPAARPGYRMSSTSTPRRSA